MSPERLSDGSIATVPARTTLEAAQKGLSMLGPGWSISNAVKGNFVATRNEAVLGVSETQASATLPGLLDACDLREQQIAQTLVGPQPQHGGPERPGHEPEPELTRDEIAEVRESLSDEA